VSPSADDAVRAAAEVLGPRGVFDLPLGSRTTYRVGGSARLGFELSEPDDDLLAAEAVAAARHLPVITVGRGSNLIVPDAGFPGLALLVGTAGPWGRIEIDGEGLVRAGAGTLLPVLARRTAAAGRSGLEWAVGVPGSVGGAVRMNAGGHGSDISGSICEATVTDLSTGVRAVRPAFELELGYRRSALTSTDLVVAAAFATGSGAPAASAAAIEEIVRWRRENQPGGQNAGSVFVNPEGDSAGRLVDAAGCRGLRLGTAEVSPKHANFIQADPGGRADEVIALIREVRRRVLDHSGVDLHPEVKLAGASWDDLG
jgi:UDP-N-acetylmuramate dehydrogenase